MGKLLVGSLLGALLVFAATEGEATKVAGIEIPDSVPVSGAELKLQGAGIRTVFVFKVYVGALYLATPTTDAAAATAAEEPKRIAMHFLRDVGAEKMRTSFEEGFFKSAQERLDLLRPKIDRFLAAFSSGLEEGTEVTMTYLPGQGTRVEIGGAEKATVEGHDFMVALWGIWLSDAPADHDLKRQMLGIK